MVTAQNSMRASSQPDVLVVFDLSKSYGPRRALQGLSFTLKARRILGLLGPNGSGKTTSILILSTMLEPDSGEFILDGIRSSQPDEIRRRLGTLPQSLSLPDQMTGREYLTYQGRLHGLTDIQSTENAEMLLHDVGLQTVADTQIRLYSHEMRQRLGIARAFVHDPLIVFMDEPADGLEPRARRDLFDLVRRILHQRNASLVLGSQKLSEIEEICDDVVILNEGQVVAKGPVSEVIHSVQRNIILRNALRVQVPAAAIVDAQQILEGMSSILKVKPISGEEGWLQMELAGASNGKPLTVYQTNNKILGALIRAKIPILSFKAEDDDLQETFLLRGSKQSRDPSYG